MICAILVNIQTHKQHFDQLISIAQPVTWLKDYCWCLPDSDYITLHCAHNFIISSVSTVNSSATFKPKIMGG